VFFDILAASQAPTAGEEHMTEFGLFTMVLPVLVPVFVGWLAVRVHFLGSQDAKALTSAFLYIFLPALIVGHLSGQNLVVLFGPRFILATAALMLVIYAAGFLVNRFVLGRSLGTSALSAFACSKFNAMVVGLPLLLVAIGHHAIVAVVISLIIGYFTILPITLFLLEVDRANQVGHETGYGAVFLASLRHVILDPLVIATIAGILIAALSIPLPGWIKESLSVLGAAAIPVPLVAVGMTIGASAMNTSIREAIWVTLVRVVASPLLAIAFARLFGLSPLFSIALVISFSLPTAKMAFAVAEKHGVYEQQMAAIVTLSTISLVVVFPLFMWICEHLWPGVIHKISFSGVL
jgi:malonate transporter and related proteins